MLIALDYDGTYTRDPAMWDAFIASARSSGHSVICATMRTEEEAAEVVQNLGGKVDRIICTSRKAKARYLADLGVTPNVWIDDNPMWIYSNG